MQALLLLSFRRLHSDHSAIFILSVIECDRLAPWNKSLFPVKINIYLKPATVLVHQECKQIV